MNEQSMSSTHGNVDNPVHATSSPTTRWSRANFAEAIQGVQTPLGWTFWDHTM